MAAAAIKLVTPRIPMILKTTLYHSLGLTEESSIWDLRTELIVKTLRSIMTESTSSFERQQNFSLRDPGIKGQMWISKVTFPAPEDDLRQLVFDVIDVLKEDISESYTRPDLRSVEAEWTGFRSDAGYFTKEPDISEAEKYEKLSNEASSDIVVLYFHGGAYYLMDPCSHREINSRLAKLTKGKTLSVRYRLAPQNPFPAAFLDCLVAYLSLLYPPEESYHEPIAASRIIFAGDSAGGNMSLSLVLFLLHIQRSGLNKVRWHNKEVEIPLPAGVATNSAWCDVTRVMPSIINNAHYDYLPLPVSRLRPTDPEPPGLIPCKIWPVQPPRATLYCDDSIVCHPFVSPLSAPTEMWRGAPPVFFCCGEEMITDEVKVLAKRCNEAGVKVRLEMYEAMPHCFAMLLDWRTPRSARCYQGWAQFITDAVQAAKSSSVDEIKLAKGGCLIEYKTGKETEFDLENLETLDYQHIKGLMNAEREVLKTKAIEHSKNIDSKL